MTAIKQQVSGTGPTYLVFDANGTRISFIQGPVITGLKTITITDDNVSSITLTQQNVTDMLVTLTAFSNTGAVV
jgi:hypothetical protein